MKKLLILSGKGGTGKTTTAGAFVEFSRAKAVADCDVDAPNLHLIARIGGEAEESDFIGGERAVINPRKCVGCGLCAENCRFDAIDASRRPFRVKEFACEGCGVCAYVCPQKAVTLEPDVCGTKQLYRGERVLSTARLKMGRGNSGKLVTAVKVDLLKNAPETELAIIDGSPGIGCPVISSVSGVDLVLVVAEPSVSGLSDLGRLVKTARTFEVKLAVCVNKWTQSPEKTAEIEAFCRENGLPFVGRIPYDPEASKAINEGRSLASADCPAGRALKCIYEECRSLLGLEPSQISQAPQAVPHI